MLTTTLRLLREYHACKDRYRHLCKKLGGAGKYGYDTPIRFDDLLDMNGLDDTLWALRAVMPEQEEDRDFIARMFAANCSEHVLPMYERKYPDKRVRLCIEASKGFAHGRVTPEELDAAAAGAWDAARAARADDDVAAANAANAATATATWTATRSATRAAAYAANAAVAAAGGAEKTWQAAYAANAAVAAMGSSELERRANAEWDAAAAMWAAEQTWQAELFRKMLKEKTP